MKHFTIYLLFICHTLLCYSSSAQSWNPTSAMWQSVRYEDLHFHDDQIGWAIANAELIKTVDGGDTWMTKFHPEGYARTVDFIDEHTGFIGTLDGTLYMTMDGGDNWTDISDRIPGDIPGICGLSHYNDHVFGVGLFAHPAYFIRSTDRGQSWSSLDMSAHADGLVDCHFIDELNGFVSGTKEDRGGVILRTYDGGLTWSEIYHSDNGQAYVWKLDFVTEDVVYAAIENISHGPTIIAKSTDGGDSWTTITVRADHMDIQGLGFINPDTGWIGPRGTTLLETQDGGATWSYLVEHNFLRAVNRFTRRGDGVMFAAGALISKFDDATVSTVDEAPLHPSLHTLGEIVPNPVTQATSFQVSIGQRTAMRLDMYASDGRRVHTFDKGLKGVGTYHYHLDPSNLDLPKSGVYHIVLRTNEKFYSQQINIARN